MTNYYIALMQAVKKESFCKGDIFFNNGIEKLKKLGKSHAVEFNQVCESIIQYILGICYDDFVEDFIANDFAFYLSFKRCKAKYLEYIAEKTFENATSIKIANFMYYALYESDCLSCSNWDFDTIKDNYAEHYGEFTQEIDTFFDFIKEFDYQMLKVIIRAFAKDTEENESKIQNMFKHILVNY